jgi:tetratricopeptide (TPR) repeat protein
MIVKGDSAEEAKLLDNCLSSVKGHIDSIYLNINTPKGVPVCKEVLDIAKKHKANTMTSEWTGNFVKARTASFAMTEGEDFVMWLDTDDTVDKPEQIRKNIAIVSAAQHGIYIMYNYAYDEMGNITVSHYVARIVRNNNSYKWQASILDDTVSVHETLVEVIPRSKAMSTDFAIIHHSDDERRTESLVRNIKLLEGMLDRQSETGEVDARTLFYLATHYFDAQSFGEAKELLQEYMQLSGWAEERCEALVYLGKIYEKEGKTDQAHHAYLLAIGEYQNSPHPYIELSEIDFKKGRYEESASWIEKCLQLPKPTTTMVQRPMESTFKAYMLAAQAYTNMGGKKLDDASKYVLKALQLRPLDSDAQNARDIIDNLINRREDIRAAMRIVKKFEEIDKDKIVPFIDSLPAEVQDNPAVLNARHAFTPPKVWGKKSIAIFVGQGPLGIWGPWSLKDGIGGSEEAVIQMSRQLAKLGWDVTIFATPGERAGIDTKDPMGIKDGTVLWKQYYEFNPKDEYNVLVSWRNPALFDADIKAKKSYMWLHDVVDKEEFTAERVAKMDKVIFVGKYHAELYKGTIPEEKWFISGNGIDPAAFEAVDGTGTRKPHRLIYMSAYNRGLKILLDNWGKIKKAVPNATLDVYYGWESYDSLNKDNPERMSWKNDLVKQMKSLPGVADHGRVGHDVIITTINEADILAYPCVFPEVYCITYAKAAAGGALPVSSNYAELGNYPFGNQIPYSGPADYDSFGIRYVDELIKAMKNPISQDERMAMAKVSRDNYSWKSTAEGWTKEMR